MATLPNSRLPYLKRANPVAKEDDLLQASKAIYDQLDEGFSHRVAVINQEVHQKTLQLNQHIEHKTGEIRQEVKSGIAQIQQEIKAEIKSNVDDRMKFLEMDAALRADKTIADVLAKKLDIQVKHYEARLQTMEKSCETFAAASAEKMQSFIKDFEDKFKMFVDACDKRIADLSAAYKAGNDQVMESWKHLPQPVVNIPEAAIIIKQMPSHVDVHFPENAIEIKQLPSVVNVPENAIMVQQMPSVVNVGDKAFNIKVDNPVEVKVAPPRLVNKSISYDEYGRPSTIVEMEQS